MRRRTAMVLKADGEELHVLTRDGEFLKVPLQPGPVPAPGTLVTLSAPTSKRVLHWVGAAVAAVLLLAFLLVPSSFEPAFVAVAHVELEINPGVRLAVDAGQIVGEETALNAEGERLLASVDLTGRTLEETLDLLVDAAIELDYLRFEIENYILLTVTPIGAEYTDAPDPAHLGAVLKAIAAQRGLAVATAAGRITAEEAAGARDMGITAGREMLRQRAHEMGRDVPLDVLRDLPVLDILERQAIDLQEMFDIPAEDQRPPERPVDPPVDPPQPDTSPQQRAPQLPHAGQRIRNEPEGEGYSPFAPEVGREVEPDRDHGLPPLPVGRPPGP